MLAILEIGEWLSDAAINKLVKMLLGNDEREDLEINVFRITLDFDVSGASAQPRASRSKAHSGLFVGGASVFGHAGVGFRRRGP